MAGFSPFVAALVSYFATIASIGVFVHRRSTTVEDFVVGGRDLNYWVTALSAHASDMSSWLFLALPGLVYLQGIQGLWVAVGLWIGMWLAWKFVAPKLRSETERTDTYTLAGYLTKRFDGAGQLIPVISGLASLVFFSVYVASGFVGIGYLFETLIGADRLLGIGLAIVVVAAYTSLGGFYSICWVDFWQALFLVVVIVLVPAVIMFVHPGDAWAGVTLFPSQEGWLLSVVQGLLLLIGWGLGYFGQAHILSKFMGIKSGSDLKKSQFIGLSWQAICLISATLIGLLAQGYFSTPLANPELAFVRMVVSLFPAFIAGLVICGVLAATISTIDSQVIVLVSVISEDFYHKFFRQKASQREIVIVSRIATLLICGIAFLIAVVQHTTIMGLVMYAWAGLGSAFGPIVLMSLHTRIKNPYSAVMGIATGVVVAAFWPWVTQDFLLIIPALVPGFLLSTAAIFLTERFAPHRLSPR